MAVAFCGSAATARAGLWVTSAPLEPDSCATVWLIARHIDADARFAFVAFDAVVVDGTPFDLPAAQLRRTHRSSTYEAVLLRHKVTDPAAQAIRVVVHDLEINVWGAPREPMSPKVRADMAQLLSPDGIPAQQAGACITYFERLAAQISSGEWIPAEGD